MQNGAGQVIEPSRIGAPRQAPFGCYRQFFNAPSLPQRLSGTLMPFARLTMDRFWVGDGSTAQPAGRVLFDHLQRSYTAANDTQRLAALKPPGTPQPDVQLTLTPEAPADLGTNVKLDGSRSSFAREFAWSLERCNTEPAVAPVCRPTVPPTPDASSLVCTAASEPVVGKTAALAGFRLQQTGFYRVNLGVNTPPTTTSSLLTVPDWRPCAKEDGVVALGNATIGNGVAVGVDALFSLGNGNLASHRLFASTSGSLLAITPATCASSEGCPADTALTFTPTGVATTDVTVTLRDQDGEFRTVTTQLNGTSSLSAVNITNQFTRSNEDEPFNLLLANGSPAGVTFEILQRDDCPGGGGSFDACQVNPAGARASVIRTATGFTYRPPKNFSSHSFSGGLGAGHFLERVRYRLKRVDNDNDFSAPAEVQIPIRALGTFTAAVNTWRRTDLQCRSCHNGGNGPQYLFDGAYSDLRFDNLLNLATPKVNLDNVEASGLLCYPQNSCTSKHDIDADPADLDAVRDWIASGANDY